MHAVQDPGQVDLLECQLLLDPNLLSGPGDDHWLQNIFLRVLLEPRPRDDPCRWAALIAAVGLSVLDEMKAVG